MNENLSLRTGELNDDGVGREKLELSHGSNINTGDKFLKAKISYPIYNPQTKEIFWLFAETTFLGNTIDQIARYLECWEPADRIFHTGRHLDQTLSFTGEWIKSEDLMGRKIRIALPEAYGKVRRMAVTKFNRVASEEIVSFLYGSSLCQATFMSEPLVVEPEPLIVIPIT